MTGLRDESLRCQEASLAKLAEMESLERDTVEHATRLNHRGGELEHLSQEDCDLINND